MAGKYDAPQMSYGDKAHTLVRAGLSAIPIIGGPATELFSAVVLLPLERRRQEWMQRVGEALEHLETVGCIRLEDLQQNAVFIDTVLQASHVALRNSHDEKIKALQNAVMNAALPSAPAQALQQMFLSWVDVFTVWHLRLLALFDDPVPLAQQKKVRSRDLIGDSLSDVIENIFPELRDNQGLYDQVWKDVYTRGLVNTESLHTMMSISGLQARRTTELGRSFLQFIETPSDVVAA